MKQALVLLMCLCACLCCDAQNVLTGGGIEIQLNADKYKVVGPHAQKEVHRKRLKYNETLGIATPSTFPGGDEAFKTYLRAYFPLDRSYFYRKSPQSRQALVLRFSMLVHRDGSISDPIIIRGVTFAGQKKYRQFKNFFKHMPNWIPATNQVGEAVDAFVTFTVDASVFFDSSIDYMYGGQLVHAEL
jgi:hypothetical protein